MELTNGLEEFALGRNREGKSHSGTWSTRYSIEACSGVKVDSRLELREDCCDKAVVAFLHCNVVNPSLLSCR